MYILARSIAPRGMHDRTLAIPAGGSQLRVRVDFVYTVVPNLVLLVNISTDIVLCMAYERAPRV